MNKEILILLTVILVLFNCADAKAQFKSKFRSQSVDSLDYVTTIMNDQPEKAIRILENIINDSNRKQNVGRRQKSYELLGDINRNTELFSESIDRYVRAANFAASSRDKDGIRRINSKIGSVYIQMKSPLAKKHFKICMTYAIGNEPYYECYEGFADALILQDSISAAITIYKEIELKYKESKSTSLARIQAKLADSYVEIKQIDAALLNYNNAQSNYKRSNKKDDIVLKRSSENIAVSQTPTDAISLRNSNVALYENRPEKVAEEKIELSKIYVKSGRGDDAEKVLLDIKPMLPTLSNNTKANYFKQSSEVASLEGDYKTAMVEYRQYVRYKDSVITNRESLLETKLSINDLQSSVDLNEKDYINELDRIAFQKNLVTRQKYIIGLLSVILLGALISFFVILRNIREKRKANKLLELRSLRSAMNPHFIFNALGSVNNYISEKDPRKANKYLADFSKLMRLVLEMNRQDLVSLESELKMNELYLKLEHNRWSDQFDYEIDIDYTAIPDSVLVPPLLIQPYIENAIWHGLRYKESFGKLVMTAYNDNGVFCIDIIDDGIGRKASLELKTKNQKAYSSTGIKNTKRRTSLINDIYGTDYSLDIKDANEEETDCGTHVSIRLSL